MIHRLGGDLGWWVGGLLVAVLATARLTVALAPAPQPIQITAAHLVLVGTTRTTLTPGDRTLLQSHADRAQIGAVSVPGSGSGWCPAASWATLGAGRSTSVGTWCTPQVRSGRLDHWEDLLAATGADHGDARLGTLAGSAAACVQAVGPGAALAAAHPDGTVPHFLTLPQFLSLGAPTSCPLTLVDAGDNPDAVLATLGRRSDVAVLRVGLGGPAGSTPPLAPAYQIGATPAGWLTSDSTRRTGILTLPDLTQALLAFPRPAAPTALPGDGAVPAVVPAAVSGADEEQHLRALAAQPGAMRTVEIVLGVVGVLLVALAGAAVARRRLSVVRLALTALLTFPPAMTLTGVLPWAEAASPAVVLSLAVLGFVAVLSVVVRGLAAALGQPIALVANLVTLVVLTCDAGLGGRWQGGSLLNPNGLDGGRWYGFGNLTFAAYASAALVVVAWLAVKTDPSEGSRTPRLVSFTPPLLVTAVVLLCEGWPQLGADLGGVLALGPALVWLLGRTLAPALPRRTVALGAVAAIGVAALVAWLDWLRPPGSRSHLGAFVQRVIDGSAGIVVARKASAALDSLATGLGLVLLAAGTVTWVLVWIVASRLVRSLPARFGGIRVLVSAALITAVLGTLLNDSGIAVWTLVTLAVTATVLALWVEVTLAGSAGPHRTAQARPAAGSRIGTSRREPPRPPPHRRGRSPSSG